MRRIKRIKFEELSLAALECAHSVSIMDESGSLKVLWRHPGRPEHAPPGKQPLALVVEVALLEITQLDRICEHIAEIGMAEGLLR